MDERGDTVGDGVGRLGDAVPVNDQLAVRVSISDRVSVAVKPLLQVRVAEADATVAERVVEGEGVSVGDPEGEDVGDAVREAVRDGEGDTDPVPVQVVVGLREALPVGEVVSVSDSV